MYYGDLTGFSCTTVHGDSLYSQRRNASVDKYYIFGRFLMSTFIIKQSINQSINVFIHLVIKNNNNTNTRQGAV